MSSQHLPVRADKVSLRKGHSRGSFNKPGIVTVRNETDILAVRFFCIQEAMRLRQFSRFLFGQLSEGKKRSGKLILCQGIEHITLVL